MKRCFDIILSALGLVLISPVLAPCLLLVWLQDFASPFYIANRVGRNRVPFRMVKLRSMVVNADKSGVDSTGADDRRITRVGAFIRKYKLDELMQLWNVLRGEMSLVGPRPNTLSSGVELYTAEELHLLDVRPGITDFASIVFSDEGEILAGVEDPDLRYNQVIRPWKSRLGLLYVSRRTFWIDLQLIVLTALAIVRKPAALRGVHAIVGRLTADEPLLQAIKRESPLLPYPPPGATEPAGTGKAPSP